VTKNRMELVRQIRKWLEEDAGDMLQEMLRLFAQVLMGGEADQLCGAEHGSRSPDRVNHRNGYRPRRWDTRVGTIDLMIPKLRKGTYFPDFLLEPRRRSERALVNVIAESYVNGVSTRKAEKLVEAMGIVGISKSQVSEMAKTLDEIVTDFRNRSLEDLEYPIVWLDAMQIKTGSSQESVHQLGLWEVPEAVVEGGDVGRRRSESVATVADDLGFVVHAFDGAIADAFVEIGEDAVFVAA